MPAATPHYRGGGLVRHTLPRAERERTSPELASWQGSAEGRRVCAGSPIHCALDGLRRAARVVAPPEQRTEDPRSLRNGAPCSPRHADTRIFVDCVLHALQGPVPAGARSPRSPRLHAARAEESIPEAACLRAPPCISLRFLGPRTHSRDVGLTPHRRHPALPHSQPPARLPRSCAHLLAACRGDENAQRHERKKKLGCATNSLKTRLIPRFREFPPGAHGNSAERRRRGGGNAFAWPTKDGGIN